MEACGVKRDEPPPPMIVKTEKGLRPYRPFDMEDISHDPFGTIYEAKKVTKRSPKQLRTFWKALGVCVSSTGRWPTKEKLCEELKWNLGYRTKFRDWRTKTELERPDSIAMGKMKDAEFKVFFDQAMERLATEVGFDPLSFLDSE